MRARERSCAHLLFQNAGDDFRLDRDGILVGVVALAQLQRIDVMRAARGNLDDLAAQRTDKIAVLPLGVDDDNIIVGRERDAGNGILHAD